MIGRLPSTTLPALLRRAFLLVFVLTVALGVAGFVAVTTVAHRLDTLVGVYEPLVADNSALLTDMIDAETGLRGYQLTSEAAFLAPYQSGLVAFPGDLATALGRVGPDRAVRALIETERQAAEAWVQGYAAPAVAAGGRVTTASEQAGKALFDRFRTANATVGSELAAKVSAARAGADRARNTALVVLGVLVVVALAAGTYAGLRVLRRAVPPLEAVTAAILRLAGGERAVRVAEEGTAEVIELARAVKLLDRESHRRHRFERRRERLRRLVADVARTVSDDLDPETVLPKCALTVGTAFGVDRVLIRVAGSADRPAAGAEWRTADVPIRHAAVGDDPASMILDQVADLSNPLVVEDPDGVVTDHAVLGAAMAQLGAVAAVCCPLEAGDGPIGSLVLLQGAPRRWSPDDVGAVADVAADLARAILRAQLFEREHRLVRELEALDRAKADFVATVSHELRTPLTSIRGYVEMMTDGTAGTEEEQARMLGVIDRNSRRLQQLVDNLLTLSRIEANSLPSARRQVPVDAVLRSVAETLQPQADAGGVLLDLSEVVSGAEVEGDPAQLDQIALNLMSNAVKFTPAGGTVTMASRVEGDTVVLTFADTGIGIPADEQGRLGDRFFRASNASAGAIPGTGLGLRIVFGLVERHGGRIGVESEPGRGTTFTLWLPVARKLEPSAPALPGGPA